MYSYMSKHADYLSNSNYSIQLSNWIRKIWMQLGIERWFAGGKNPHQIRIKQCIKVHCAVCECVCLSVCVCLRVFRKPGPCIEPGLPVGTMNATTPTLSPRPSSQRAFIWACTWVLQTGLNASVPQNKGAECPLEIHPAHQPLSEKKRQKMNQKIILLRSYTAEVIADTSQNRIKYSKENTNHVFWQFAQTPDSISDKAAC